MSTAIATFSAVVPSDHVTGRQVFFTINSVAQPPVSVAPSANTASISCNPGDLVAFYVVDANVVGLSADSNIITETAPPVPATVPTTPIAQTLTFTNP